MARYVVLSRLSAKAFDDRKEFKGLAEAVKTRIKDECPGVKWKDSYATMGRFDFVDVVEVGDPMEVERLVVSQKRFSSGACPKCGRLISGVWERKAIPVQPERK